LQLDAGQLANTPDERSHSNRTVRLRGHQHLLRLVFMLEEFDCRIRRLTGLPDDFVLTGTFSQASERICRMVPPQLTRAIAESLFTKVLQPYKEKKDEVED
jgi:hypothetical protein